MEYKYETLKEAIDEERILVGHVPLDPDLGFKIFGIVKHKGIVKEVKNELQQNDFLYQVFDKRVKYLSLDAYDDIDEISLLLYAFGISTPGEVVIFVVTLLDIIDQTGDLTFDSVINYYYNGWFDKNSITTIVDRIMKPKLCKNSYIY